jgi:ELWxxDGT repeat protein
MSSNGNTRLIANIEPEDAGSANPEELFASADRVYFHADLDDGDYGVWSSDGTGSGTHLIFDVDGMHDRPVPRAAAGNIVYFTDDHRLWKSDGTPEGTVLVKQFKGSILAGYSSNGRAYFEVENGLWTTDGTEAGTIVLAAKSSSARVSNVISVAGQTYFMLDEVLYATDGTRAGTRSVARVPRDILNFADRPLVPFGGSVLLFARNGWWRFSTSAADAVKFKEPPVGQVMSAAMAGTSLLVMDHEGALWKTDGTAAGTVKLAQINSPSTTALVSLGARVVFSAHDGMTGYQVWVSDGTADGTKVLVASPGAALELFAADGVAYFAGSDIELWQTDGTANGTRRVADVEPETTLSPRDFARAGDLLYFAGTTAATGRELWAYPLPQNPTVTVDDVRVRENAGSTTVTVRLTRAATRLVAVSYQTVDDSATAGRDYTAASGTVTFEPGQTSKTISIAVTDNGAANAARSFFVKVSTADVLVERAAGAAVIEDDDTVADVSLTAERTRLTVTNDGPSAVSNVILCFSVASVELQCTAPVELASGATFSHDINASDRPLTARVTQWERDANPANNQLSMAFAGFLTVDPATPRAGSSGTLTITLGTASADRVVQLSSSDPSVLSVPATVTLPAASPTAVATLTAHKGGVATITATAPNGTSRITVHVAGASEALRLATILTAQRGSWRFGDDNVLQYRVQGVTLDGAKPSGTVTVFERGVPVLSAPVVNGMAGIAASHVQPGLHAYTATYSGDANFFPAALPEEQIQVSKAGVSMIAYREPGSSAVTVTIRGVLGRPPTGTVNGQPLVRSGADSSSMKITSIAATVRSTSVSYSGDTVYESATLTIPIANSGRGRSVRH